MKGWILYAVMAGAAYGLSAIPLRYGANRGAAGAPAELMLMASCLGTLLGGAAYLLAAGRPLEGAIVSGKASLLWAGLSGLIGAAAGFFVIKALAQQGATASGVMALVNTSVLFALVFGVTLLQEMPQDGQMVKAALGALLIFGGSMLICL